VRQGFLELAAAQPGRINIVDAYGDVQEIHQRVVKRVEEFLVRRGQQ
jgi:thymidylate kinase